ncbi:MAG: hypothetical protein OEV89_02485 [Desulfobulbaceae bacterium]|nr:hypothetical protein [Desulfobulbaceae bacterium]HIJ89705.1 hypothetical protein [Deltaproteobacteria bacterium]
MRALLVIMSLIYVFPAFSQAQAQTKSSPPVSAETKGTVQTIRQLEATLQEHQQAIELEKKATEKKIARLSPQKKKSARTTREKLKNRLKTLEAVLKSIKRDKKILAATLKEYQPKFGSLAGIHAQGKELGKQPVPQRDIIAIETSEPAKNAIMAEILDNKDDMRLMQLVNILITHTKTMDESEKEYWRNLPPSIPFEHRFRLLDILATERQKLAALERICNSDIQQLNKHHLAEWKKIRTKNAAETKSPPRKPRKHPS